MRDNDSRVPSNMEPEHQDGRDLTEVLAPFHKPVIRISDEMLLTSQ